MTDYEASQDNFGTWYGEPVQRYHPPHDLRHQLTLLAGYNRSTTTVNVQWQFGSGLPFTRALGFDELVSMRPLMDYRRFRGTTRILFEKPYQARLPTYHRLDVSLERRFELDRWSAFDFKPGRSYRFEARTPDGGVSSALVARPDIFPEVVIQIPWFSPTATINALDIENLADLRLIFCGREADSPTIQRFDVPLIERVSKFQNGFTTRVSAYDVAETIGLSHVYWVRVLAMAAGPDWPDFDEIDEETLALPDSYSNIENGVGFLGGIASRLAYWPGFQDPVHEACHDLIRRW